MQLLAEKVGRARLILTLYRRSPEVTGWPAAGH